MGMHNLGPGSKSPITGARPDACAYCHAPHSGLNTGLWNQKLTTQIYTTYGSNTEKNTGTQPMLGSDSNQCLSCHDGTVAVGATVAYGQVTTRGSMNTPDVFGSNMQSSHPFSLALPLKDNIDLVASLAASGKTADPTGAVKLIKGNVECTSCHNPHVQAKDLVSQNFLVKDSSSGQMCLACHDPDAADRRPGESAGRLVHQRACPVDRPRFRPRPGSEATPPWRPTPASPAIRRTTPPAQRGCCAVRMNRIALPATTAARTSRRWRRTPTCLPSTPRPRSGIHFPATARPIRTTPPRARCSTTTVMPPAWTATTDMDRNRLASFRLRR